jgi:hypothetical protein
MTLEQMSENKHDDEVMSSTSVSFTCTGEMIGNGNLDEADIISVWLHDEEDRVDVHRVY